MSDKYKYNSWPLGKVPKELQRPELDELKNRGYEFSDPRDVVDIFEEKVAKFAGSKYAVSVDCCSHGLFLSLKYLESIGEIPNNIDPTTFKFGEITIPSRTYVSAPMQINQANYNVKFEDIEWSGLYQLKPTRVWDGAVRWTKDMYVSDNALQVVSFQIKKRVPIGKGGIILTDDKKAYEWLKLARYDGRDMSVPYTDDKHILMMGYHMYMTPEDAARGIILMDEVNKHTEEHEDSGGYLNYTDVSKLKVFNK
jgi:dTDP-4-amino-4,6-dideoxygalactose transaminase